MSAYEITWLCIGFGGQALFTARFLVQWLVSEHKKESVIPIGFWYLSLSGGWLLLTYAIYRMDPVIITGQAFGCIIYIRNLILIHRKRAYTAKESSPMDQGPATLPVRPALRKAG